MSAQVVLIQGGMAMTMGYRDPAAATQALGCDWVQLVRSVVVDMSPTRKGVAYVYEPGVTKGPSRE